MQLARKKYRTDKEHELFLLPMLGLIVVRMQTEEKVHFFFFLSFMHVPSFNCNVAEFYLVDVIAVRVDEAMTMLKH